MIKYAMLYTDFIYKYDTKNINLIYDKSGNRAKIQRMDITEEYWKYKVDSYIEQDKSGNRDYSNNVSMDDFEYYREIILNTDCYYCAEPFTHDNRPTLDRIDNSIGHTKENCELACNYCNRCRANHDIEIAKLRINLRKYALLNKLPFTLASFQKKNYNIIRKGITGGLSNVQHRINIAGENKINKLFYDHETNTVSNKDTDNIMTHYIGMDFNSLYPSAFSSVKHEFINYTNNKMYMPGKITAFYDVENKPEHKQIALDIINNKQQLFIVEVKGHIDRKYLDEFINFLPIFRNIEITNSKEMIGEYMFDYMTKNNMKTGNTGRKLTQLAEMK
jgi:hypothetical protein